MNPADAIVNAAAQGFRSFQVVPWGAEGILARSRGEVMKPETVNYRTFKPEKDGLLCEAIFGSIARCPCRKESPTAAGKRSAIGGRKCEVCGAEIPRSKSRSRRFGHVGLATPVAHPWFRAAIATAARLAPADLESLLLRERYVILDPANAPVTRGAILDEAAVMELWDTHGDAVRAGFGGEAVLERVRDVLPAPAARNVAAMFFTAFPILPPDFRPMVALDAGRFATSDLLDLYRRVINRNNRLRRLQELNAPEIILRNEARMLQEAVDAALDNEAREKVYTGPSRKPLRSVSGFAGGPAKIMAGLAEYDAAIVAKAASLDKPRRYRRRVTLLRGLGLNLAAK